MPLPMTPSWHLFVLHEEPQRGLPCSAEHLHDIRRRTPTLFEALLAKLPALQEWLQSGVQTDTQANLLDHRESRVALSIQS